MIRTLIYGAEDALAVHKQLHRQKTAPRTLSYQQGCMDSWETMLATLRAMQDRRDM
jgi:hypothetical protein